MPRTIVHVQENFNNIDSFFLEAPKNIPNGRKGYPLDCNPELSPFMELLNGLPLANGVREAGSKLYDALYKHPAVKQAIDAALTTLYGSESPIYVLLDSATADQLPWECLYEQTNGFLALDGRWPVARLKEPLGPVSTQFSLQPPLRILAILSAVGEDANTQAKGKPEWDALWKALVENQAADGVEVSIEVLVGEEELKDQIDKLVPPAGILIRTEFISDRDRLISTIANFKPHLLHFFCHGSTQGTPHLLIGTRSDWEVQKNGSIALTAVELRQQADKDQVVWLVTLNCCESAAQSRDARNLASSLVTAGFPAALGMREPVDSQNAYLLTAAFFRTVLRQISSLPVNGQSQIFEWPCALLAARSELAVKNGPQGVVLHQAASEAKQWTIPVMYTRNEPPFYLSRLTTASSIDKVKLLSELQEMKAQCEKVEKLDVPADLKNQILAELKQRMKQIEAELRA